LKSEHRKCESEIKNLHERLASRVSNEHANLQNHDLIKRIESLQSTLHLNDITMNTLRTSQQSTIEHYESLLTKLREKSLNAHHLIDGQIEVKDSRLKASESEVVKYKNQTVVLQQKVAELDSFLANYSKDQEELGFLQLENQDMQRKIQRLKNGMTPEHREYEIVESKIVALEKWHKKKESEIKRRLEVGFMGLMDR
jgi:hypothetical protein